MFCFAIYLNNRKNLMYFSMLLSKLSFPGFTIVSFGNIGLGKTTLAKGFIGELSNYEFTVKSPTYSLTYSYASPRNLVVNHFDLYRFVGFFSYSFFDEAIYFFEWGSKLSNTYLFDIGIYFFFYSGLFDRFMLLKSTSVNFFICLGF